MAHTRPVVERCLTWSGIVPLPAFLFLHVARELSLSFASDVSDVVRPPLGMLTKVASVLLVWLPLGVHLAAAATLLLDGRRPQPLPHDVPPLARVMSRVCAAVALIFLVHHAQTFTLPVWLGQAAAEDAGFRLLAQLSSTSSGVPLSGALYLLGLAATAAHAALGVHRGLLAEGLLATPARRTRSARVCALSGAALFGAAAAAVIRVATGVLLG